jgi:hypothetical protein
MPKEWGIVQALELVPPDEAVIVVDSLETWGANDTIRLAVMDRVKEHPARLKLVIAGTNAEGGVSGVGALERADDATVYVELKDGKHTIRLGKRRWPPCEAAVARAEFLATAALAEELADGSLAGKRRGEGREPDFSLEAIAHAASWSVREMEGYLAQLRAQGVPRDTLLGWARAIEEHRGAMPRAATLLRTTQTEDTLSEGTMMAYEKLLRSWPSSWSRGVRMSEILKAIARDGLDELADALRELAGTSERIPSATALGNGLKWVRDKSVEGRKLTRVLDRNGIALWSVVREE